MSKGVTASLKRKSNKNFFDKKISKFGEVVIKMLPEDLAFTLFLPSEKAFDRYLSLNPNESLVGEKANDTYAILTRVLGFSTVPRTIHSADLQYGKEIVYDSISGFNLYILKDLDGMLVVNRVASEHVDLKLRNIIVHVMNGVIMDSEFEESVQPNDEEEEEGN
ncbi:Fasciclin-like arabinogalactan family protein [Abeliophyllum distichum]|uniref:Fasciclin-like arabinogalactan family protein n=1 Tax=Abeliophyllum distichum TaxID=126358 RepID=A0ABD1ULI2_9LAMI